MKTWGMKVETAIKRILEQEASKELKLLQLENLALRQFPSSPNQKTAIAAYQQLRKGE